MAAAVINVNRRRAELQQFTGGGYRSQNTQQRQQANTILPAKYGKSSQPKDPECDGLDRRALGMNRTLLQLRKRRTFQGAMSRTAQALARRATEMINQENNEYVRTTQEEMKRRGD